MQPMYCPRCERQHDLSEIDSGAPAYCACGAVLYPGPRARMRLIRQRADLVCRMILTSACPSVEIALERGRLRELARSFFPDRMELYEMIYESRFDRLIEQFRAGEDENEIRA
jgi:hypothetical protein